jgi:hypothetical protein
MAQAGEWPPDAMSNGADGDPQRSAKDAPPRKAMASRDGGTVDEVTLGSRILVGVQVA